MIHFAIALIILSCVFYDVIGWVAKVVRHVLAFCVPGKAQLVHLH